MSVCRSSLAFLAAASLWLTCQSPVFPGVILTVYAVAMLLNLLVNCNVLVELRKSRAEKLGGFICLVLAG